jgi:hypothetical protein
MGALLLFVVAIPIVSSKLDSLWSSEFTFHVDTLEPMCVPPGLCFRFFDAKVRHTDSGYRIAVRIEGVDNVYDLAKELDDGTLKVILAEGGGNIWRRRRSGRTTICTSTWTKLCGRFPHPYNSRTRRRHGSRWPSSAPAA